jgi:chromosome segregation ATPase
MAEKVADIRVLASELVKRMNEDGRRIRMLEQRVDKLENNLNDVQGSVMAQSEDLKVGLSKIVDKLTMVSDRISKMEADLARIEKEARKAATKAEVKQLESFIDLVNPITSKFVTRDELDRAFAERPEKRKV